MQPFYFIEFFSSGVKAEFFINHFPVMTEETGYQASTTHVVNRWLGQKNNHFKLKLDLADYNKMGKEAPEDIPEKQSISVTIFSGVQTEKGLVKENVLWQYSWPDPNDDELILDQARVIEETVEETIPVPLTRLWQYAEPIKQIDVQAQHDIMMVLKGIRQSFSQHDYENAYQFMRYRYEDEEIAEYMPANHFKPTIISMWQDHLPKTKLLEYPPEAVKFALLDNQRAVHIQVTDQDQALTFEGEDDTYFGIDLFLCKVNQHWIVIR
ncbi:hypothetical protein HR060_02165 [Catenovulum sp. SM1970]|uniref:hypothetical protein n=1 Tax=Marinifaba aquimaris TaxID=2741323 RepID=UPI0015717C9C|nr:hypothetical protein [Marinifaba aquimaris]NTS75660.1 hypothetical protein [Marinifaba aquimaris]